MKNILVPTDFSDCAQNAARAAVSIAARLKASARLANLGCPARAIQIPRMYHTLKRNRQVWGIKIL